MNDIENIVRKARDESNPQNRAVLWGECILHVLSLEDIREGLTFDEIRAMSDEEATQIASHMQSVLEMRSSWHDDIVETENQTQDRNSDSPIKNGVRASHEGDDDKPGDAVAPRKKWPEAVARAILTKCHFRCCVCPERRRIADLHHIDGDNSNSVENNGVALCKSCHTDAHTTSTMQRNLLPAHLREFKQRWEETCKELAKSLVGYGQTISNVYYMNVHRLDSLLREVDEVPLLAGIPHRPPARPGTYSTLWANPKNPLEWSQLLDNRSYFESRLKSVIAKISCVDLNLLEFDAIDATEQIGEIVTFNCQLIGHDIPDQNELVDNCGLIEGPPPTMRREVSDPARAMIRETCLMLDSRYMYSDSSFIQFSEDGVWSGIARLTKFRKAIGSNDGPTLRDQIVLTPICIGTPGGVRKSAVASGMVDSDKRYLQLVKAEQAAS